MNDEDRIDAALTAMFATADRAPDEAFVARVERAVFAERKMAAATGDRVGRFAFETVAIGALYPPFTSVGLSPADARPAAGRAERRRDPRPLPVARGRNAPARSEPLKENARGSVSRVLSSAIAWATADVRPFL